MRVTLSQTAYTPNNTTIDVTNERLYLAPLINEVGLEKMDNWPETKSEQTTLLKNLAEIWKQLKSEFRRCEKFGNYTVVENDQDPTIRISITLSKFEISDDSLFIPVKMQVERISDRKYYLYTIPTSTLFSPHDTTKLNAYHSFGAMLSRYRRYFPYRLIVSFFYAIPKS